MSSPLIVVVCGDPGGAAAVAPVVHALRAARRAEVRLFAYGHAGQSWAQCGLASEALEEPLSPDGALERLRRPAADLLLTGTSVNSAMLEHRFIAAARALGVPSLAVLDFWLNYVERFTDTGSRLSHRPDRIAVMDERAQAEMVAEGFDASSLVVTGQPAFDDLAHWRDAFTDAHRQDLRARWGTTAGELVVLFVSQPFGELYGAAATNPLFYGFHEQQVLALVIEALEEIARDRRHGIMLIVRPHPREDAAAFAASRSSTVRVLVSSDLAARDAALAADLVTGMNSVVLMEACYLQCLTVSLQPGLRRPDVLPTNRLGLSRGVYEASDIRPALDQLLFDEDVKRATRQHLQSFVPREGSADRVVALIDRMLTTHRSAPENDNVKAGH
jgi:hypothetical protein